MACRTAKTDGSACCRVWQTLVALALLQLPGCHRVSKPPVSVIEMGDDSVGGQILPGFYQVEDNRWRWSAQRFAVALKPPPHSEKDGARLVLRFYLSDGQIQRLGPMTLTAEAEGHSFAPQTFSEPGEYWYTRQVPAALLDTNILPVQFRFDKAVPPAEADGRELAAVVTVAGLLPKR